MVYDGEDEGGGEENQDKGEEEHTSKRRRHDLGEAHADLRTHLLHEVAHLIGTNRARERRKLGARVREALGERKILNTLNVYICVCGRNVRSCTFARA